MDIFQRTIHSNVKRKDDDHLTVTSALLDLEHSFHLELTLRVSTRTIEDARASMSKAPLSVCYRGIDAIPGLVGLRVDRGIMRQINERLGGPRGCTHMVELLTEAVRLLAMILVGKEVNYWSGIKRSDLSEEEIIAQSREGLKNTCLVFAEE